jgi:DNA-binding MarR family transcriptional regulator
MSESSNAGQGFSNEVALFTNHALALIAIWRNPHLRIRDIAERIGITERAVHRILEHLTVAGYIEVVREGRRNCYQIRQDSLLPHPFSEGARLGALLQLLSSLD